MPLAAKLADIGTQHDGYHETVITAGSPTVSFDGLPAARLGDPLTPHAKLLHPHILVKSPVVHPPYLSMVYLQQEQGMPSTVVASLLEVEQSILANLSILILN